MRKDLNETREKTSGNKTNKKTWAILSVVNIAAVSVMAELGLFEGAEATALLLFALLFVNVVAIALGIYLPGKNYDDYSAFNTTESAATQSAAPGKSFEPLQSLKQNQSSTAGKEAAREGQTADTKEGQTASETRPGI